MPIFRAFAGALRVRGCAPLEPPVFSRSVWGFLKRPTVDRAGAKIIYRSRGPSLRARLRRAGSPRPRILACGVMECWSIALHPNCTRERAVGDAFKASIFADLRYRPPFELRATWTR